MKQSDYIAGLIHALGLILQLPVYLIGMLGWGVFVGITHALAVYLSFVVAALVVKFTEITHNKE